MSIKLSVIVPTYNEVENLTPCIEEIISACKQISYEIVVIDSGSTDGTKNLLDDLCQKNQQILPLFQKKRMGMGAAIKEAWEHCHGQWICHFECDRPFDFNFYLKDLEELESEKFDFVLGVRRGKREGLVRYLYTLGYRLFTRALFGIKFETVNYSYKLYSSNFARRVDLFSCGWFVDAEIMVHAKRQNLKIKEHLVPFLARNSGTSTVRFTDVFAIVKEAVRFAFCNYSA